MEKAFTRWGLEVLIFKEGVEQLKKLAAVHEKDFKLHPTSKAR